MKCFSCGAEAEADMLCCPCCGMQLGIVKELVAAAEQGEQNAVAQLYRLTYNSVYQSVRMLIRDEDAALDIVQDAYIRGFRCLKQLKEPNNFRAWMKRIGINTAKNYLMKKAPIPISVLGRQGEDSEDEVPAESQERETRKEYLPEEFLDSIETSRILREIVESLHIKQRIVVTMYFYGDMNIREIGEELGLNENTVRSRLNAGKKILEKEILAREKRDGIVLHAAPELVVQPEEAVLQKIQKALAEGERSENTKENTKEKTGTETKCKGIRIRNIIKFLVSRKRG